MYTKNMIEAGHFRFSVQTYEMYASNVQTETHQAAPHPEIPEVTQDEVRQALNRIPNGRASEPDGIFVDTHKAGDASLEQ